jgi:probable selenium-dependent hydroxylase accessory protein YqeC
MLNFWKLPESEPVLLSFVGGGGKTNLMVALAQALVANGRSVIATTTTRIFAAQMSLAPVALTGPEASPDRLREALNRSWLVSGGWSSQMGIRRRV